MAFHQQVRFGDTAIVGQRELDGFVERASAVAGIDCAKNVLGRGGVGQRLKRRLHAGDVVRVRVADAQ